MGPTTLVIGGSGGLGGAICTSLAADGWDVALTYRGNRDAAEAVAESIAQAGRRGAIHQFDVLTVDIDEAARNLVATVSGGGHLRGVVWAAGPTVPQVYLADATAEQWGTAISSEARGFFATAQAAIPALRDTSGALVALTTAALRRHAPADVLSTAPKAAIEACVRAIAREEGRHGVRANAIGVGAIEAGMFERLREDGQLDDAWVQAALRNIPLRRLGTAAELAAVACFLLSSRAAYVTGQCIDVDGGYGV